MDEYTRKFRRGHSLVQRTDAKSVYVLQPSVKKPFKLSLREYPPVDDHFADTLVAVPVAAQSAAHASCRPARESQRGSVFRVLRHVKHTRTHVDNTERRFILVKCHDRPAYRRYADIQSDPVRVHCPTSHIVRI